MPLIVFEGPRMDGEKKRELVRAFVGAASRVTGIRKEAFTTVFHENAPENIGVGEELLPDRLAREGAPPPPRGA